MLDLANKMRTAKASIEIIEFEDGSALLKHATYDTEKMATGTSPLEAKKERSVQEYPDMLSAITSISSSKSK